MKNYAQIDENNLVINISIASDDWDNTGWIDCTNKSCYIGDTYNSTRDAFIAPEPEGNLGFDEATCRWIMPVIQIE